MAEGYVMGTSNLQYVGINIIAATTCIVGIEVNTVECHIVGRVNIQDIVGQTGRGVSNQSILTCTNNCLESNRVGGICTRYVAQCKLLIESL